jgi:hypothetical protein
MKKLLLLFLLLCTNLAFSQGVSIQSATGSHMDVEYLNSVGVKNLRIQIKPIDRVKRSNVTSQTAFTVELGWALRIVEECNNVGIKPIIAFNELLLVDSLSDETPQFWTDTNLNKSYINIGKVVAKFANKVYAYEFISEPVIVQNGKSTAPPRLEEFYTKSLQIVRQRDTSAYFILTPGPWGMPTNYSKFLPFNIIDNKLMYNFHMYLPFNYTHQGLNGKPKGIDYPLVNFNVDTILKRFKVVSEWSNKYNYPIFLGEFNTARWSKNSDTYVQDVINAAKLYKFEWSYFAFKPNYRFWNPYYEIANPTADPTKYYLKYVGSDTQHWLMIQYNLK